MSIRNDGPVREQTVRQPDARLDPELDCAGSAVNGPPYRDMCGLLAPAGFGKLRARIRAAGTETAPDRLYRRIRNMIDAT